VGHRTSTQTIGSGIGERQQSSGVKPANTKKRKQEPLFERILLKGVSSLAFKIEPVHHPAGKALRHI